MNKDMFEGQWNEIKGKIKEQWGKLTDDEITQIRGKKEQLLGKLQSKYGWTKEKAEEEFTGFLNRVGNKMRDKSSQFEHASHTANNPSNKPNTPNNPSNPSQQQPGQGGWDKRKHH